MTSTKHWNKYAPYLASLITLYSAYMYAYVSISSLFIDWDSQALVKQREEENHKDLFPEAPIVITPPEGDI